MTVRDLLRNLVDLTNNDEDVLDFDVYVGNAYYKPSLTVYPEERRLKIDPSGVDRKTTTKKEKKEEI